MPARPLPPPAPQTAARRCQRPERWLGALPGLLLAALLAGCGTPPVTRLHSLLPAQTVAATAWPGQAPLAISLAPPLLPLAADQPQWLVRLPDDTLLLLEHERWASPLRDELAAALQELLAQRWAALPSAKPAWHLALALSRFESMAGREARLEGRWTLAAASAGAGAAPLLDCRLLLREPAAGAALALAEAHRRIVGRLADQIGQALRSAGQGASPACPAADA